MINVGIEMQLSWYRFIVNAVEAKVKRRGATSARKLVIAVIWDQNKAAQGKPISDSVAKIDFFFISRFLILIF